MLRQLKNNLQERMSLPPPLLETRPSASHGPLHTSTASQKPQLTSSTSVISLQILPWLQIYPCLCMAHTWNPHFLRHMKGLQICYNNGSDPMQKWLRENLKKKINANNLYFYAHRRISNNICHFEPFEKSKTTSPFDRNEALRLHYLTVFYQD